MNDLEDLGPTEIADELRRSTSVMMTDRFRGLILRAAELLDGGEPDDPAEAAQ